VTQRELSAHRQKAEMDQMGAFMFYEKKKFISFLKVQIKKPLTLKLTVYS
jgi:hypothetical protein